MKNNLTLEQVYLKSKGLLREQAEDEFVSEVDLTVYPHRDSHVEIEAPRTTHVKYRIDIEYRSWGIKSITPYLLAASPFSFDIITYDENDDPIKQPVEVDLSRLEDSKKNSDLSVGDYGQVFPFELAVHLNSDQRTIEKVVLNF
jgi:hypothetical protein